MIHIIICGHGEFATGIYSGANLLCGVKEHCDAVNFTEGMSAEDLSQRLQACIDKVSGSDASILFLTDILGGTPFRECAALAAKLNNVEVVSGANLQMLTEASIERDDAEDVHDFARDLVDSAKECMTLLSDKLAAQKAREASRDDDGI